jgi:hypothetical protein
MIKSYCQSRVLQIKLPSAASILSMKCLPVRCVAAGSCLELLLLALCAIGCVLPEPHLTACCCVCAAAGPRQLELLRAAGLPCSRKYSCLDAHRWEFIHINTDRKPDSKGLSCCVLISLLKRSQLRGIYGCDRVSGCCCSTA